MSKRTVPLVAPKAIRPGPGGNSGLYGTSSKQRQGSDWYVEEVWADEALFDVEPFFGTLWDPACGGGRIPKVARARGFNVRASDIKDRRHRPSLSGIDFLGPAALELGPVNSIISNVPYRDAARWLERAMLLARHKIAFFLRAPFFETDVRDWIFEGGTPLVRVHFFKNRVSCPPGGRGIQAKGGKMPYAWFVWDMTWPKLGDRWPLPTMHRIGRPKPAPAMVLAP